MMLNQTSRMDMLKAQALAARLGQGGQAAPMLENPYAGIQLANQPVQSMLKPKYTSNMGGQNRAGLYSQMVRGYSGGLG